MTTSTPFCASRKLLETERKQQKTSSNDLEASSEVLDASVFSST